MTTGAWCPQHGRIDRVDEDGCCIGCGIDAMGAGADEACRLAEDNERLRETNRRLNRRCQTYEAAIAEKIREHGPSLGRALALGGYTAAIERLATLLREDQPWPLVDIVAKLVEAAEHLLRAPHDCDCLGWESFAHAQQAAREWLSVATSAEDASDG